MTCVPVCKCSAGIPLICGALHFCSIAPRLVVRNTRAGSGTLRCPVLLLPAEVYQVSQKKVVPTTCSSSKCNFFLGHLLQKTSLDQVWVKAIWNPKKSCATWTHGPGVYRETSKIWDTLPASLLQECPISYQLLCNQMGCFTY